MRQKSYKLKGKNKVIVPAAGKSSKALDKKEERTQRRHNFEQWISTNFINDKCTIYSSIEAAYQLKQGNNLQPDPNGMCFTKALNHVEKNNLATMHLRSDGHIIIIEMIDDQKCQVLSFGAVHNKIELTKNKTLVKKKSIGEDEGFLWTGKKISQYEVDNSGKKSNEKDINLDQKLSQKHLIPIAKSYFKQKKKAIYVFTYPQNLDEPDPNTAFRLFVEFDFENPSERITINIKCGIKQAEMIAAYSDKDIHTQGIKCLFTNLNQYIKKVGLHEDRELLNQLHTACQIYNVYDEVG